MICLRIEFSITALYILCSSYYGCEGLSIHLLRDGHEPRPLPRELDGSVTVSVFDVGFTQDRLACVHSMSHGIVSNGFSWLLNGTEIPKDTVSSNGNFLGWIGGHELVLGGFATTLRRVPDVVATEGLFRCRFKSLYSVFIGVYYPISSVIGEIEVVSGREGTFRVRCTSTGGNTMSMSVSGPRYSSEGRDQKMTVESVGTALGLGNDSYTAITDIISGGYDGDVYNCTASNGLDAEPTSSVILKAKDLLDIHELMSSTVLLLSSSSPPTSYESIMSTTVPSIPSDDCQSQRSSGIALALVGFGVGIVGALSAIITAYRYKRRLKLANNNIVTEENQAYQVIKIRPSPVQKLPTAKCSRKQI